MKVDLTDPVAAFEFFGRHNLRYWTALYSLTSNPVFAWKAIRDADKFSLPVPAWAMDYFVRAGASIADIKPEGKSSRDKLIEALELTDGALSQAKDYERRLQAWQQFNTMTETDPPLSKGDARHNIAEHFGIKDDNTIAKWVREIDGAMTPE